MSTNFRLRLTSGSGTPSEPPINAWPVGYGNNAIAAPPTVSWPQPSAIDGLGRPAGIVGRPWAEFGRDRIDATGYAWYNAFFGSTDNYVSVRVKLYDERAQGWSIWEGYMWRPTHAAPVVAGIDGPEYTRFRVKITELTSASW